MIQWLRLYTPNAGGMGLILDQGTKIPYANLSKKPRGPALRPPLVPSAQEPSFPPGLPPVPVGRSSHPPSGEPTAFLGFRLSAASAQCCCPPRRSAGPWASPPPAGVTSGFLWVREASHPCWLAVGAGQRCGLTPSPVQAPTTWG